MYVNFKKILENSGGRHKLQSRHGQRVTSRHGRRWCAHQADCPQVRIPFLFRESLSHCHIVTFQLHTNRATGAGKQPRKQLVPKAQCASVGAVGVAQPLTKQQQKKLAADEAEWQKIYACRRQLAKDREARREVDFDTVAAGVSAPNLCDTCNGFGLNRLVEIVAIGKPSEHDEWFALVAVCR